MKFNYMGQLKNRLVESNKVEIILYLYSSGIKYAYSSNMHTHSLILAISDYNNLLEVVNLINKDTTVLMSSMQEYQYKDIHYVNLKIANDKVKFLNIYIVNEGDILVFLDKFNTFEVLKDKNHKLKDYEKNQAKNSFWPIPDEMEFSQACERFFLSLIATVLRKMDGDILKANLIYDDLVDELLDILNVYISLKYDSNVYVDSKGSNLKVYLENDLYEEFEYIVNLDRTSDLWTGLFKMARVYRQVGLQVADQLGYQYPKEEDVKIMQFLRDLYNKEN